MKPKNFLEALKLNKSFYKKCYLSKIIEIISFFYILSLTKNISSIVVQLKEL